MAIPDIEGIDYTAKEYLKYVQHIRTVVDRLNAECANGTATTTAAADATEAATEAETPSAPPMPTTGAWNPHRVELALWSHYITRKHEPTLLDDIPELDGDEQKANGNSDDKVNDDGITTNGSTGKFSKWSPVVLNLRICRMLIDALFVYCRQQ